MEKEYWRFYTKIDETILEISTDKVDSEVFSASGILLEILYKTNETVPVGEIIS